MSRIYEALHRARETSPGGETLIPVRTVPATPRPSRKAQKIVPPLQVEKVPEWMVGVAILRKHWRMSATFAAVILLTVIVVTFSMRNVYTASTRIEVDPQGEQFSLTGAGGGDGGEYLETQAKNLKNDRLAIAVVRKLRLDQNPDILPDPKDRANTSPMGGADAVQLSEAEDSALGVFHTRLIIQRDTASRLITIGFSSHNPELSAQVANAVAETFIEQTYQDQHDAIMRSTNWLSRQLDDIRARMEQSNKVVSDFGKSIGVTAVDNNKNTFTEQMSELSRQLTQAEVDRIQLEALLSSVQKGGPDSLPEVRNNPVVQQIGEKLAQQRAELSQALVVYGPNHPTVKKLRSEVEELQAQLDSQKTAILSSVRTNYAAARAREQLMNSEMKGTSSDLNNIARYNQLQKDAQTNSELYNSLYAQVKQAGIAAASRSGNLRVVDEARTPSYPTSPNRKLNLAVGLLAALLGGVVIAFLREQVDTRIFSPDDVRPWIGSSSISIMPMFVDADNGRLLPPAAPGTVPKVAKQADLTQRIRFLADRPHSPEGEAMRSLYTSLMLSRPGGAPQVVLVVSSFPGEGKTTIAVNLAMALAQHGSTCVVDGDLRRGRIAAEFGVSSKLGLSDVLAGTVALENAVISVPNVPNLAVIPAHAGNPHAGQLICSEGVADIINRLRKQFRFVIVDSAPLLPFADGRALSTQVDGVIFVGRSGITTREVIRQSLRLLNEVHSAPILEFVLNAADLNSAQYKYYRYGYEYYEDTAKQGSL